MLLERLIGSVWQRAATPDELQACRQFLAIERQVDAGETDDSAAWIRLTHALLMANETIFVD